MPITFALIKLNQKKGVSRKKDKKTNSSPMAERGDRCTVGWSRMKSTHDIHRHILILHERVSERISAAERASGTSNTEQANEWAKQANKRLEEQMALTPRVSFISILPIVWWPYLAITCIIFPYLCPFSRRFSALRSHSCDSWTKIFLAFFFLEEFSKTIKEIEWRMNKAEYCA